MKAKYTGVFVTLAGILCLVMQNKLLSGADKYGLLPSGHFASFVIVGSILAVLVLLGVYYFLGSDRDFRIPVNLPVQAIGCLAAAAGMGYWAFSVSDGRLFLMMKLLACVCFLALAIFRFQGKKSPLIPFAVIGLAMMVLCFGQYRVWSRHTQLHEYLFPALSALFCTLYSLEFCAMELPDKNCKKAFILNQAALFTTVACLKTAPWPYYAGMSLWLLSGMFLKPGVVSIPLPAQKCMEKLEQNGFSVYAVGGCVRDSLLGNTPSDYDLCTNATPEEIARIFDGFDLVRTGEKHGTIGVVMDKKLYEITTYRTEGSYADNRHPDSVVFVDRVEEDLARRDFTINAMAFHPQKGIVDPYGGQKDLFAGVLRAVGDPKTRFREDSLRILRGVRFACRFRLDIEPDTRYAMNKQAPLMENLAPERIFAELNQILCHMEQGDLVKFRDVVLQAVPELEESVGFRQHNPHHAYDVFTHTDYVLSGTKKDPALRWAALLHDIAKPKTFTLDSSGKGHFYGHAKESAQMANDILTRLRASNALREQVVFLIEHHMDMLSPDQAALRRKLSHYGMDNLKKLVNLQQADKWGKGTRSGKKPDFEKILAMLDKLEKEEGRLQLRDLEIDGHDLMALGYPAGPELGACQKKLLEQVLEGRLPNEREALLDAADKLRSENIE